MGGEYGHYNITELDMKAHQWCSLITQQAESLCGLYKNSFNKFIIAEAKIIGDWLR